MERQLVGTALGGVVATAGIGIAAAGVWARVESHRALERERIVFDSDSGVPVQVRTPHAARSLASTIRERTLATTQGRTYAETAEYLAPDRTATSDASRALEDERTGTPVRNPEADLWISSTTLQVALTQAYMAFRIADLTSVLGVSLIAAGAGIAAASRR